MHLPRAHGRQGLYLPPGKIDDLRPIKGLLRLESLRVSATLVQRPLAALRPGQARPARHRPHARRRPRRSPASTSLTELQFDETEVTDVSPLAGLKKLEMLQMKRTRVSDVSPLRELKSLKNVYLEGSRVEDASPPPGDPRAQDPRRLSRPALTPSLARRAERAACGLRRRRREEPELPARSGGARGACAGCATLAAQLPVNAVARAGRALLHVSGGRSAPGASPAGARAAGFARRRRVDGVERRPGALHKERARPQRRPERQGGAPRCRPHDGPVRIEVPRARHLGIRHGRRSARRSARGRPRRRRRARAAATTGTRRPPAAPGAPRPARWRRPRTARTPRRRARGRRRAVASRRRADRAGTRGPSGSPRAPPPRRSARRRP